MPIDVSQLKLGKLPYIRDPRALQLKDYMIYEKLPLTPATNDWMAKVTNLGMMLNNTIGCCAIAGPGHRIQTMTANAGVQFIPPDSAILTAYEAVSGYKPGNPSTDNGCYLIQVMKYLEKTGIAGHKIAAFAQVNILDLAEVEAAINIFGGIIIGLALPLTAKAQTQNGQSWTIVGDPTDTDPKNPAAPGSWGGHCVDWAKRLATQNWLTTWGMLQEADPAWLAVYMDEGWAVVSQDWIMDTKKAPSGVNFQGLMDDLPLVKQLPQGAIWRKAA